MVLHLVAYILPGLMAAVALPMALGVIPPNAFYGFRTPKTRSSPEIWYPANRFSGWLMIAASGLAIGFNLILWWMHPDWPMETLVLWMACSEGVWLLLSVVASFLYLRRL